MSTLHPETNFTTSFSVAETPQQVFAAINNVRGWWSEEITGNTDKLGEEFKYHFHDLHRCTMQITEFVPDKRVVWRVLDNYFSFTQDKTEWIDTQIIFEISKKDSNTVVHFTHVGLVPEYECFNACSEGWRSYINSSLKGLISTGKGQPNVGQAITDTERVLLKKDFSTTISVDQTPQQVFAAINNVRSWWTGDITGDTDQLGDEFTYRFKDFHYSKHKITELIPDKKIVWRVPDARLNFAENRNEWTGTKIVFEIAKKGNKTEVCFTHAGLTPELACYDACSGAWREYINGSLRDLITTGKTVESDRRTTV